MLGFNVGTESESSLLMKSVRLEYNRYTSFNLQPNALSRFGSVSLET